MWRKVKSQYDRSDYGNYELICKYIIPLKGKEITRVPMEKNENITLNSSSNILHIGRQIINGPITINDSNNVTLLGPDVVPDLSNFWNKLKFCYNILFKY